MARASAILEEIAQVFRRKTNFFWQETATALLKKYIERYYSFRKKEWELPHLEYRDLDWNDPNFPSGNDEFPDGYYRILVEESQTEIVAKLKELKALIEAGDLKPWQFGGLRAIWFGQHLYEPLLHLAGSAVEVSPVPLNLGERHFLDDLRTYFDKSPSLLKDRELYLLRNMSKGRGVGFFEMVIFTRTSSFGYLLKESSTFHSSIPRASGIWALPTQQW